MLNAHNNENGAPLFVTKKTTSGFTYMRSAKGRAGQGRRVFTKKPKGTNKGGIAQAYLPEELYTQLLVASKATGRSLSDITRAGVIREIGGIAMVIEAKQPLEPFNLQGKGSEAKPAPVVPKGHVVVSKKDLKELHAAVVRAIKISSK